MANPYSEELRERAVRAYEGGEGTYLDIAEKFSISTATLQRWVARSRKTGSLAPLPKAGGWASPVDVPLLLGVLGERPDSTADELAVEYNRRAKPEARVHRSSIVRALRRCGYVFKKSDDDLRSKTGPMFEHGVRSSRRGRDP